MNLLTRGDISRIFMVRMYMMDQNNKKSTLNMVHFWKQMFQSQMFKKTLYFSHFDRKKTNTFFCIFDWNRFRMVQGVF